MVQLRDAVAILRNRTDLVGSSDSAQDDNLGALWEAIDLIVDLLVNGEP